MTEQSGASEGAAAGSLFAAIEDHRPGVAYWISFAVLSLQMAVEYFDMFVIGFLVADFGPTWQLSYAETSWILLGAGVGSIAGSLIGGMLSDHFGRRPLLIVGNIVCGLASGGLAFVPDGAWPLIVALRIVTGLSVGLITTATLASIVERTPRRQRTLVTGLSLIAPSGGVLLASLIAGQLMGHVGWRGVAALGAAPLLIVLLIIPFVPESIAWQIAKGRVADARRNAARLIGRAADHLTLPAIATTRHPIGLSELFHDRRRFWLVVLIAMGVHAGIYGTYLWAPSILAAVGHLTPAEAAGMFAFSSSLGMIGKLVFSIVPSRIGRWRTGILCLVMGTASLLAAAAVGDLVVGPYPAILFCFAGVSLFLDGGSANFHPYSAEIFPVRLASRGVGLAQAGNGAAKILGPMSIAVIAGSSDVMKPAATAGAITPAFLFLAGCAALGLIAMLVVRIETHGRNLTLTAEPEGGIGPSQSMLSAEAF